MASAFTENEITTLKCRKCRYLLLEQPPHRIAESSSPAAGEDDYQEASNTFNICDDNLPQWIADAVDEGSWTKGKLSCPGCGCRLGGFDYVTRASEPVYIVKSKVDIKTGSGSGVQIVLPGSRVLPDDSGIMDSSESGSQTQDTSGDDDNDEDDTDESAESNTESDHVDASRESSSSDEDEIYRSSRQKEKMRRRRRKRDLVSKQTQRDISRQKRDKIQELLDGEPELSEINDDLICPVCLDMLHEPFQVDPCGHVFCEPCLRRLGQKNPMNCTCPLCRTKIFFCKHQSTMSKEIRENHHSMYMKRKKFERSTPVFQYPLPWQPGWRNLLRGRPLGGNTLQRDNRVDWVRTILHQIPYYIPPVIIANIINIGIFAFMMGFIEIFPNLLALVFGTSKNMSLILNTTSELGETSGDVLPSVEEAERSLPEMDEMSGLETDEAPSEDYFDAFDVTLAYAVFISSIVVAGMGQVLMHLEQHGWNRQTDISLVMLVIVVPLMLVLPLIVPWRNSEGSWIGALIEKATHFFFYHMNYYTAILLCFTVWFVYHVDINDDLLW